MQVDTLDTIFRIFTLISYIFILVTPFLIGIIIRKNNYLILLLSSVIFTLILSVMSGYWSEDLSKQLIYDFYGFDPYGMGDAERWTQKISIDNRNAIEKIYEEGFGIGWPLRLIMSYVIFLLPYNLIACGIVFFLKNQKNFIRKKYV